MSTFKNPSRTAILQLPTPEGGIREVKPQAEFEGSNYYQRFVTDGTLELVSQAGGAWQVGNPVAGAVERNYTKVVAAASTFATEANIIDFTDVDEIGGPAHYVQLECTSGEVRYRFNGDTDSKASSIIANSETQILDRNDFLANSIELDASYSGAAGGTLVIKAIGVPK